MTEPHLTPDKRSWTSLWRSNPITMTFAAVGLVAVVAATTTVILNTVGLIKFDLLRLLSDSDEAPIRVRNGSLELRLLDPDQKWENVSSNNNPKWKIKRAKRHQAKFDITVAAKAGAVCTAGPLTAIEPVVQFTYSDGVIIVLQAEADTKKKWTTVLPTAQMTANANVLTHGTSGAGYLSSIAAGASLPDLKEICSFANKDQLDSILILNVK
jgi:hypothetical protein